MVERRGPQLTRRDPAGRTFADLHVHGFVGEPPTAACGAGPLVTPAGRTFDPDAEGVDICLMCTDNVRRYERWRAQGVPDRRQ